MQTISVEESILTLEEPPGDLWDESWKTRKDKEWTGVNGFFFNNKKEWMGVRRSTPAFKLQAFKFRVNHQKNPTMFPVNIG